MGKKGRNREYKLGRQKWRIIDNNNYHLVDRGGLWAWGADVPLAMKPKLKLRDIFKVIFSSGNTKKRLLGMKQAMDRAPRPWLK